MDSTANQNDKIAGANNVFVQPGIKANAEVIFLPTDNQGSWGQLNSQVLDGLGIGTSSLPYFEDLTNGYAFMESGSMRFCYIVTIGEGNAATLLKKNLRAALRDKRLSGARSFWIPLMGTGDGGLTLARSQKIILDALKITGWINRSDVTITIAPPSSLEAGRDDQPQRNREPVPPEEETSTDSTINQDPFPDEVLPLSASVTAALTFAAALRSGRRENEDDPVTTTLLFFALAESKEKEAPHDLAQDRAAKLFSGAVHFLVSQRDFRRAWNLYFSPGFKLPTAIRAAPKFTELSDNVQSILTEAAKHSNDKSIEIDGLIRALLKRSWGRYNSSLHEMGISGNQLLTEYVTALAAQIQLVLHNDRATDTDRLDYEIFATAIKDFLTNANTSPPLSISIQAPWGAGKSSLMRQIQNKLDPKPEREKNKPSYQAGKSSTKEEERLKLGDVLAYLEKPSVPASENAKPNQLWTVWFNAWKYDTSEQIWAGMVDAIVSQICDRLKPADRELFLLRLQLARIDDGIVRRKIYDRVATICWSHAHAWLLAGIAAIGTAFGLNRSAPDALHDSIPVTLLAWSPAAPLIVLAIYIVKSFSDSRRKAENERASFSLAEYLTMPNYSQSLGNIHQIHKDLLRVLSLAPIQTKEGLASPSPIVVFIDDLDRCSPSKIVSVVEGVCLFLADNDYRCMFVIGIDPQMIAAALEEAHAQVREQLPRYERTVPLGWRFMDKFIQLPFTIPPSSKDTLGKYINWLNVTDTTNASVEPSAAKADLASIPVVKAKPISPDTPVRQPFPNDNIEADVEGKKDDASNAIKEFKESRDVGVIIQSAALGATGNLSNPREIKRLANIARLYLGLRDARRVRDSSWDVPNLDQYARWIIVTVKWPDMMRWLQWGADEGTWTSKQVAASLTERRLQVLQDLARADNTAAAWAKSLALRLNVPASKESDWA